MSVSQRNIIVFAFFTLIFLGFFFQFPINGSLPGNTDTWYTIALSNTTWNKIVEIFTGQDMGTSMYPETNVLRYGESAVGGAFLFFIFRILGANDIWAYYFFISLIFILNSFATFLLAENYTKNFLASVFAGFALSCSNFLFANIDDSIVFLFFFPIIAMLYLKKFIELGKNRYLVIFGLLAGFQIYFSLYVFVGQFILFFAVIITNIKTLWRKEILIKAAGIAVLILVIAIPWVFRYRFLITGEYSNPLEWIPEEMALHPYSLYFPHLFNHLPGNPLYSPDKVELPHFLLIRLHAFLGFGVYVMALMALFQIKKKGVREVLIFTALGFLLAFAGTNKFFYAIFPPLNHIRGALRFFVLSSIGISILSAYTISWLSTYLKKKYLLVILVYLLMTLHYFENITFPLLGFKSDDLIKPTDSYIEYFENKPKSIILNLPCKNPFGVFPISLEKAFTERLYGYNRETMYMNHQTYHKQNIINGNNGYFPLTRLMTQELINRLPDQNAIDSLVTLGMDHVVYNKYLVLPHEETLLDTIQKMEQYFQSEYEDDEIIIFSVRSWKE